MSCAEFTSARGSGVEIAAPERYAGVEIGRPLRWIPWQFKSLVMPQSA